MFLDMGTSQDVNAAFKAFVDEREESDGPLPFDASVLVLTAGAWPIAAPKSTFSPPSSVLALQSRFSQFYNSRHSGRRLSWLYHMCKGDVRALCFSRRYEFVCTAHQAAALLMLNDVASFTMAELVAQTQLDRREAEVALRALLRAKVLAKRGANFGVNSAFKSKRLRMRIGAASASIDRQESSATRDSVGLDRTLFLQAAIVRVMKARKVLPQQRLIAETVEQARSHFSPPGPLVKRCIAQLIEKEFLEVVESDQDHDDDADIVLRYI